MHLERYRRHHRPSDAAHADRACQEALANRLQFEAGSAAYFDAIRARVEVLAAIALSDIRRDSHLIELDEALDELHPDSERPPDREAIHLMATIGRITGAANEQPANDTYVQMIETADALRYLLENTSIGIEDPAWWTRWGSMHRRAAEWAEWAEVPGDTWLAHLRRASERLELQLAFLDPNSETYALANLLMALTAKALGIKLKRESELNRAIRLLAEADDCGGATPPLTIDIASEASYLSELLQDIDAAVTWIDVAATALLELEQSDSVPLVARLAADSVRSELAGNVAALATGPTDVAWNLHRVRRGLPNDSTARRVFLEATTTTSADVTTIYIAQSRRRCRAVIVDQGEWSTLEMPALATDRIGSVIRDAHFAHERACGSSNAWATERKTLHDSFGRGLEALTTILERDTRPVAVHLSGWLHTVPFAPILSAAIGHVRTIAVSLGLDPADGPTRARTFPTVALSAPGDSIAGSFLTNAEPDVNAVAKMMSCPSASNATVHELTAALIDSEIVLFAGHGVSGEEPLDAHLLLQDGKLTAAEIMELDLVGLKLAVVAACESSAIDRRTPEHPFNVQVALLHAGASATCGPQWAIDDGVASRFTRSLFDELSQGQLVHVAFSRASAEACASQPGFRDISLIVRNAAALAAVGGWRFSQAAGRRGARRTEGGVGR